VIRGTNFIKKQFISPLVKKLLTFTKDFYIFTLQSIYKAMEFRYDKFRNEIFGLRLEARFRSQEVWGYPANDLQLAEGDAPDSWG